MVKIIKMLVLALLLVIMGRIGYRYYKQSNWRIGSLSERGREIAKKGFEKSMGLVGVGEPTIKKAEAKLSLTPTPPPPLIRASFHFSGIHQHTSLIGSYKSPSGS